MNQPHIYVPLPLDPPSHLPPHLTFEVATEPGCELPGSHRTFPLAISLTCGSEYVSCCSLYSSHPLLAPFPGTITLFSVFGSPVLLCKQVPQCRLSRSQYVCIYMIMYGALFSD